LLGLVGWWFCGSWLFYCFILFWRGAAGAWLSFPVPVSLFFGWVFWGRTQVELGVIGGGVDEDGWGMFSLSSTSVMMVL
jgi:hypothetical protein